MSCACPPSDGFNCCASGPSPCRGGAVHAWISVRLKKPPSSRDVDGLKHKLGRAGELLATIHQSQPQHGARLHGRAPRMAMKAAVAATDSDRRRVQTGTVRNKPRAGAAAPDDAPSADARRCRSGGKHRARRRRHRHSPPTTPTTTARGPAPCPPRPHPPPPRPPDRCVTRPWHPVGLPTAGSVPPVGTHCVAPAPRGRPVYPVMVAAPGCRARCRCRAAMPAWVPDGRQRRRGRRRRRRRQAAAARRGAAGRPRARVKGGAAGGTRRLPRRQAAQPSHPTGRRARPAPPAFPSAVAACPTPTRAGRQAAPAATIVVPPPAVDRPTAAP